MKTEIQSRYEEPLNEFTEMVLDKFGDNVISIVLFGSVARGTAARYSDIDLLVISKKLPLKILEREEIVSDIILKIIKKYYIRVCPVFLGPEDLSGNNINPLFYGVITGYRVLYDPKGFWNNFLAGIKPLIINKDPVYIEGEKRWRIAQII